MMREYPLRTALLALWAAPSVVLGALPASGSEATIPPRQTKEIATLSGHSFCVYWVAFTPDGTTLVSGALDSKVKLWDVGRGKLVATLEGHTTPVESVAFSHDGQTVASADRDGNIRLWDVANRRQTASFRGHTGEVVSLAFSRDGRTLASAGYPATGKLWDVARTKELAAVTGEAVWWRKSPAYAN